MRECPNMAQLNFTDPYVNRTVDIDDIYMRIGNIIGYYLTPLAGILGIVMNAVFCYILRKFLHTRFYALLFSKQVLEFLGGMLTIGW